MKPKKRTIQAPHAISSPLDEITAMDVFLVAPRWLFVKITTRQGFTGWGEGTLEGRSEVVAEQLKQLQRYVIGADPENIAYLYEQISIQTFYHTCPILRSALSAIDIALWDIKGKRYERPVYALLGGMCNDRIRCYRWFGGNVPALRGTRRQASAAKQLATLLRGRDRSETAYFKMNAIAQSGPADTTGAIDEMDRIFRALKRIRGDRRVKIGIDCHGRLKGPALLPFFEMIRRHHDLIWFVEEAVPVETLDDLQRLDGFSHPFMLATGERVYTLQDFARIFESRRIGLIQPDLGHCGGITAGRRIADLAANYEVGFAPHCPNGPILLAASLQIQAYTPAYSIQETSVGIHYNAGRDATYYLKNPTVITPDRSGFVAAPRGLGLGIEVDQARVEKAAESGITWDEAQCFLYRTDGGCPTAW